MFEVFLNLLFPLFLKQCNIQEICRDPSVMVPPPPALGFMYTRLHTQLLRGCSEMQTQVFMQTQKILYSPSHLCSQGPSQGETTRCAK